LKSRGGIAYLTAEEMAEFDRAAIEDFGMDELILMENAGVAVAGVARRMLGGTVAGRKVSFLVGKGNNGGDGLVAARHLSNWGARVGLLFGQQKEELRDLPAKQLVILGKMGISSSGPDSSVPGSDILVDALFGYNLKGDPREPAASLIRRANASKIPILAVDIPSGLGATSGQPGDPCIMASATVTLGLPKTGFLNLVARKYVGGLYLADLSFPAPVYMKYSQKTSIFQKDSTVKIW
jgi:NAD(P)H-hydrate epimerase